MLIVMKRLKYQCLNYFFFKDIRWRLLLWNLKVLREVTLQSGRNQYKHKNDMEIFRILGADNVNSNETLEISVPKLFFF